MRRDQLEHAIRAACQILGHEEVVVVGSQAILGTYDESDLPERATMSAEIDILPIAADGAEVSRLADLVEGVAGELSPFQQLHGFSIDGVDLSTCVLPDGWRQRLVEVSNHNTTGPGGAPVFTGWCLERHDLCVAKLCALREKDTEFVRSLLESGLVDLGTIRSRLDAVDASFGVQVQRAREWLGPPSA
jgi:hypothetical protein